MKKKKQLKVLWMLLFCLILVGASGIGIYRMASSASDLRVSIVGLDGSGSNLRVSQLLSAKVEGVDDSWDIEYKWTNGVSTGSISFLDWNFVYYSKNMNNELSYFLDYNKSSSYSGTGKYFAIADSKAKTGTIRVDVKATKGAEVKTASASYTNFKASNLSADITGGTYGMFVGDKIDAKVLLGNGGMLHTNCSNTTINLFEITGGSSSVRIQGTEAIAQSAGYTKANIKVTKGAGCTFHSGTSGTGIMHIYVFQKPTPLPTIDSITLGNTIGGVSYTIDGVTKTAAADNQNLIFNNLKSNFTYEIEMKKVENGITFTASDNARTLIANSVILYMNGHGGDDQAVLVSQATKYSACLDKLSMQAPVEDGYDFGGWYLDEALTVSCPLNGSILQDVSLYAKWTVSKYTVKINLKKDNTAISDKTVALYQGGKEKYSTTYSSGAGQYQSDSGDGIQSGVVLSGTYDLYIDGKDCGQDVTISYQKSVTTKIRVVDINYYTLTVKTYKDTASWDPEKIELFQNGQRKETMTNNTSGEYQTVLRYEDGESNTYRIFVEGTDTTKDINMVKTPSSNNLSLYFNGIKVPVYKDDVPWDEAIVKLAMDNGPSYTLLYQKDSQVYGLDGVLSGNYNLIVEGIKSGSDTKTNIIVNEQEFDALIDNTGVSSISNNRLDFYTVTFYNGSSPYTKFYLPQIILRNHKAVDYITPTNYAQESNFPFRNDAKFTGWKTADGEDTAFDFDTKIAETTSIYAGWNAASVVLGAYAKTENPGGNYYTLPNLSILGYASISRAIITVTTGKIVITENTDYTYQYINGNATTGYQKVIIRFPDEPARQVVESYLRSSVKGYPAATGNHTIEIQIIGDIN